MPTEMSELVVEAAAPATRVFEGEVLALRPRLVRRLALVVGDSDEAEDLAQDACLRAIAHEASFQGESLWPWLQVIGVRLALNELRRRRRAIAVLLRAAPPPLVPAADIELWDALRQLPRNQRAALALHVLDGVSYAEIGDALHVPEGTVASWVSRAKARLRVELGEERS
jgi:RNA polymerase sigma-70 factor (ECF subfamily)